MPHDVAGIFYSAKKRARLEYFRNLTNIPARFVGLYGLKPLYGQNGLLFLDLIDQNQQQLKKILSELPAKRKLTIVAILHKAQIETLPIMTTTGILDDLLFVPYSMDDVFYILKIFRTPVRTYKSSAIIGRSMRTKFLLAHLKKIWSTADKLIVVTDPDMFFGREIFKYLRDTGSSRYYFIKVSTKIKDIESYLLRNDLAPVLYTTTRSIEETKNILMLSSDKKTLVVLCNNSIGDNLELFNELNEMAGIFFFPSPLKNPMDLFYVIQRLLARSQNFDINSIERICSSIAKILLSTDIEITYDLLSQFIQNILQTDQKHLEYIGSQILLRQFEKRGLNTLLKKRVDDTIELAIRTGFQGTYHTLTGILDRFLIESALKKCSGNISKSARVLGMNRATFYKRLKSLGIMIKSKDDE